MNLMKKSSIAALAVSLSSAAYAGDAVSAPMATAPDASCPWNVSVEYLSLKSYSDDGDFSDQGYESGYRISASYAFESDLAFRVNYFDYDALNEDDDNMAATALDFELVSDLSLGSWQGDWSVGLRMAEYQDGQSDSLDSDFSGLGLTVGAELHRSLSSNFGIYVKARTSLIFGDDTENSDDTTLALHELGAGVQFDFAGWSGCDGNIRLGYENQMWSGVADDSDEDSGLAGFGLRVNVAF